MTDRQLFIFYCVFVGVFVSMAAMITDAVRGPTSAQEYADKLCQELYGPQTGAVWIEGSLNCESARGEIIELKKPR